MSGSDPLVGLSGTAMARIVSAIPIVAEQTGRPVVLVGGLAVMCRLRGPYRVTTDLDTVDRRRADAAPQLELLVLAGATPSGPAGALVATPFGDVQVDVLSVTDADLARLPEDPNDRLHVMSHAWAAATATSLTLVVAELAPMRVAVAEPGPIITMKLQAIMNRGSAKEGTDLLDIIRLTLDGQSGPRSRGQLLSAGAQLRTDALLHVRLWFERSAPRSLSRIRAVPEGRDIEPDDLALVGELLAGALED